MHPLLALLLCLLLVGWTGCERRPSAPALEDDTAPVPPVLTRIQQVVVPRKCGRVPKEWLQAQPTMEKAQGVVAEAADLAARRGAQVDELNTRVEAGNGNLANIAAALQKRGCVETVP